MAEGQGSGGAEGRGWQRGRGAEGRGEETRCGCVKMAAMTEGGWHGAGLRRPAPALISSFRHLLISFFLRASAPLGRCILRYSTGEGACLSLPFGASSAPLRVACWMRAATLAMHPAIRSTDTSSAGNTHVFYERS